MASSLAERKPGGKKSRLEEGETRRVKKEIARKNRRMVGEAVNEHGSVRHGTARVSAAQSPDVFRRMSTSCASKNRIDKLSELSHGAHREGRSDMWARAAKRGGFA